MTECPDFDYLLVMPRLRVQSANAISSPLTHGFPAMSAFIGLMWALQRKTVSTGMDIRFQAVSVVVHDHEEQVTDDAFVRFFRLTRNPIKRDGKTSAIVEEGRIHLDISLIFAVTGTSLRNQQEAARIAQQVKDLLGNMRIAGGTVVSSKAPVQRQHPYVVPQTGDSEGRKKLFNRLKMQLLPGFLLVERQDLLEQRYRQLQEVNPDVTRLDAWLSLSRINWRWQSANENVEKDGWHHDRAGLGWVVPIPVGYGALTEMQQAGTVANARDNTTPFRFVESLFGIGQWLSPHRLENPQQMLWFTKSDAKTGLYRCCNRYKSQHTDEFEFDFS